MLKATLLHVVLQMALLPEVLFGAEDGLLEKEESERQVGVTLFLDRHTLAPGEIFKVSVSRQVLGRESLTFPSGYYDEILAQLYLKTPDGEVFVYWPYSEPRQKMGPLRAQAFTHSLRTGQSSVVLTATVSMVNPSPNWLAVATGKTAQPNFRAIGKYEAWADYRIPEIVGTPMDAWHGKVQSPKIQFVVREVPFADRRAEPTAEQLADLKAVVAGKLDRMSSQNRLETALRKTENEGLAGHIAGLLREHQPHKADGKYPPWWDSLHHLLSVRAYHSGALGIAGPYLTDFAAVSMTALEHRMAKSSAEIKPFGTTPRVEVGFLIAYSRTEGDEKSALAKRLTELARRHAKVPPTGRDSREHRSAHFKLSTSWYILFELGVLRDEMPFPDATKILGEPQRRGDTAQWYYPSRMHVNPMLNGSVTQGTKGETIRFTNRHHLR